MTVMPEDQLGGMTLTLAVAQELRAHMARQRVSQRQLARILHVSHQWVSQRLLGVVAMSTVDIERIASALGISERRLLLDALNSLEEETGTGTGIRR